MYPPQIPWLLPVSLVIGGFLSGALVFGLDPEAEGHGAQTIIKKFQRLRGTIRRRVLLVKAVASAGTIGSGGPGGREGPIAQIDAGFASFPPDFQMLRSQDRRIMMMVGVAGRIGSLYRGQNGAAFFSAKGRERHAGDLEGRSMKWAAPPLIQATPAPSGAATRV